MLSVSPYWSHKLDCYNTENHLFPAFNNQRVPFATTPNLIQLFLKITPNP
jgi:hypothetical protein